MTKLSDTQAIILSAAAQRPDGNLLPLPGSLRGGAAARWSARCSPAASRRSRRPTACRRRTLFEKALAQ